MDNVDTLNDWITVEKAAELTGYEKEYIRQLFRLGKVSGQKFGYAVMISKKSLLEYYSQQSRER